MAAAHSAAAQLFRPNEIYEISGVDGPKLLKPEEIYSTYIKNQKKNNWSSRIPMKRNESNPAQKMASERCARLKHKKDFKNHYMDFAILPAAGVFVFCLMNFVRRESLLIKAHVL